MTYFYNFLNKNLHLFMYIQYVYKCNECITIFQYFEFIVKLKHISMLNSNMEIYLNLLDGPKLT